ncbi:MAG: hypothetical protein U0K23_11460 [Selenomonadaceae bacterium]|nr:hypothetical protein [Selenomonadaceae bacterium]
MTKCDYYLILKADYQVRKLGITDLAKASGVSRHTIYFFLKENNG